MEVKRSLLPPSCLCLGIHDFGSKLPRGVAMALGACSPAYQSWKMLGFGRRLLRMPMLLGSWGGEEHDRGSCFPYATL